MAACLCSGREPGSAPGGAVTFFCFAKRKSPKKRRSQVCDPCAALRGRPAAGRLRRAPRNSLRAEAHRSNSHGESVNEARALRRTCHPATAPPQAQPQGVDSRQQPNSHTGRRCARPGTRSVARAACYLLSCAPGHRRPKKPWSSRPHCPATLCRNVCAVAGSESLGMDQNEVLVLLGGNVAKSRPSPPGFVTSSTWQSTRLCPTR